MDASTRSVIEATWREGDAEKIRRTLILLHSLGRISNYERNYYGDRLAEATARRPAPGEAVRRLLQPPTASSRPTTTVGRGPLAVRVETPKPEPQLTYVENVINAEIQAYRKKPTERALGLLRAHVSKIEDPRLRDFYERKIATLPSPPGAPAVAEWAVRAEVERRAQPQQAGVFPFSPQNVMRALDVPRGVLVGSVLETNRSLRGEPTYTLREVWENAVRGESPLATGPLRQWSVAWSNRHFNPDHPTVSMIAGATVQAAAIFGGLIIDAATDPLTWAFAPFSGAKVLLSPRQGAQTVERAVQQTLGRAVGRSEATRISGELLQQLREYGIYYNHLGEERLSAGVGFYTMLRNRLQAMGIENAEELAEATTRRAVADLAPQIRIAGRPVFRRSPGKVELDPVIARDVEAAQVRRGTRVPFEQEHVPAGRVGQTPPGAAPRPTVPVEAEVRPQTPPPSEAPTIPPQEARPPVPRERATVPQPETAGPRDFFEPGVETPAPGPVRPSEPSPAAPAPSPRPVPETPPETGVRPAAGTPEAPPVVPETPARPAAPIEEMLERGETPPEMTAGMPNQDLFDLVARTYERAGLPVEPDRVRRVVESLPRPERTPWRDALAMMFPARLSRAWNDALVHSLYFPRSVTDQARTTVTRALSGLRHPEEATMLHALQPHRVRVSPTELMRARAAVSLDLVPRGQNVWEWLSQNALPEEAEQLIRDARAVWSGGGEGAAVRANPARYAAVRRFEAAEVQPPARRVRLSPEERLEAAFLAAGHGAQSRDLARAAMTGGRINRQALPPDVRRLLDETELVGNVFRYLWNKVEIPAEEVVQGLRDFGVEVESLEPISRGYVPQRGVLPEWAVKAVEDPAIFLHATEANVWDALVKAAIEGDRPNLTLALDVLVNSWLSSYENALRHLTLLQTIRADPLTSSLRFKPEPGLGRFVRKGSLEAEKLARRGWKLMTQSDGRTPLPGLETEDGVWLVPGPFARQYHIRSTLNGEMLSFGALSKFLQRTRGVFVNFALNRLPFLRTNFLEQFLNLLMTFGPEGEAREAAMVINQVLRRVTGRSVPPEMASTWATGAKTAARVYLTEVLSSFQVAPPMTVLENLDRGVLTSVEKMVRAILPDATDEFVQLMAREIPSVRATGHVGQIRMLESEVRRMIVPQALRALGWTVDDLLHFSGRVWQGLEDSLLVGGYVALRAQHYSPSGARRQIFQGFVGYMREMYPVMFGVLSNFAWFTRFEYGRSAQYVSKALDRPVWLYVLAQSYDRQDRARAEAYGRRWRQWLLAANVARRKDDKLTLEWHPIPWEAVPEALLPTEEQLPFQGEGQTRIFFLRQRTPDETIWEAARFLRNPYRGMERYLDPVIKAYLEAAESGLPLKERAVSALRELPGAGYFLGPRPVMTPWLREKQKLDRQNEDRIRRGEKPLEMRERPEADKQLEEQLLYARLMTLMAYYKWVDLDVADFTREELEEMVRLGDEQDKRNGKRADNWLWPREVILDAIEAKKEGVQLRPFGKGPYSETERALAEQYRR